MPPLLGDFFRLALHIFWVYLPQIMGGALALLVLIVAVSHLYDRWKQNREQA